MTLDPCNYFPILAKCCLFSKYNFVKRLSKLPDFDVDARVSMYGYVEMTSLYLCHDNKIDILNLLMDLGASMTVQCEEGRSPLLYAAEEAQLATVRAMINHGAEVTAEDLAAILRNGTRKMEETVKTVEAVLEVHQPSQAEVRAAAEQSHQVSPP